MDQPANNPDFVLSLARGLRVMEVLQAAAEGRTVSQVAAESGLSRAAVRRLLLTLEAIGYATHAGPAYRLTDRVLRIGGAPPIAALAGPVLAQLSGLIHESCSLSVLVGDEIAYVARSSPKRVMTIDLQVGSRLPAYCTSMGRVLLAALPLDQLNSYLAQAPFPAVTPRTATAAPDLRAALARARDEGFALVDEELELGLRSIAVPVVARSGQVVAAMNSGVSAARVSAGELVDRVLPLLREQAARLGRMLP